MWDKLDWELWRVVAKQMGPVAVLELLVELPGDVALVGGLIPRSALHEELADPFSLKTVSEHELEEPVELARDYPFKLTRYLLLADTDLSQLTQRHVTDVLEHMFQRYFVTPTLANGGLAAQRRMGRPLSDRWNAAAASALCADLGRVLARAQPRGEPVPQLDAALVRMELANCMRGRIGRAFTVTRHDPCTTRAWWGHLQDCHVSSLVLCDRNGW